ncbi:MAG TPA: ABC transporter ATPase [Candidatus Dormibacteraeota bacterium]|nr:ABC transporter ATPase [Candidatus Dormibacteraeota bacterium]
MRELTGHRVNPANDRIKITVGDERGAGGANHVYFAEWSNDTFAETSGLRLAFQNGPINENGVNGITQEVLLEIVADRLRSFQAGPYASRHNALALTKIEEAQHWLHARTLERVQRGVEGTSQK